MTSPSELEPRISELLSAGRLRDAAQIISDQIAESGEAAWLWNDWAMVQFVAGEFSDAERALRRALALEPESGPCLENLGALLFALDRKSEALPYLRSALTSAQGPQLDTLRRLIASCAPLPPPPAPPLEPRRV